MIEPAKIASEIESKHDTYSDIGSDRQVSL
jgi:hypothetical protein